MSRGHTSAGWISRVLGFARESDRQRVHDPVVTWDNADAEIVAGDLGGRFLRSRAELAVAWFDMQAEASHPASRQAEQALRVAAARLRQVYLDSGATSAFAAARMTTIAALLVNATSNAARASERAKSSDAELLEECIDLFLCEVPGQEVYVSPQRPRRR